MKRTKPYLYLSLSVIICLIGCSPNENIEPVDTLPPITTTGECTMGCFVDGELFLGGRDVIESFNYHRVNYGLYYDSILYILTADKQKNLTLVLETLYHPGDTLIPLYDPTGHMFGGTRFVDFNYMGGKKYGIDKKRNGWLKILKETPEIIAGTFSFDGINKETGDTVHITQGRFDIAKLK